MDALNYNSIPSVIKTLLVPYKEVIQMDKDLVKTMGFFGVVISITTPLHTLLNLKWSKLSVGIYVAVCVMLFFMSLTPLITGSFSPSIPMIIAKFKEWRNK